MTILEETRRLLEVTACSVWLLDPTTHDLVCRQATELYSAVRGARLAIGQGVVGWVFQHGKSVVIPDTWQDERYFKKLGNQAGLEVRSMLAVPLQMKQQVIGVLIAMDTTVHRFKPHDVQLLESLATHATIAIENARLYTKRKKAEIALQKANEILHGLAMLDGLTQIANRRRFDEYLQQVWRDMAEALALIMCDVDYFKKYNDTYGHLAGDDCLQKVAQQIHRAVKEAECLVARYGGEEFVIILPRTDIATSVKVAEHVQLQVENLRIPHHQSKVSNNVTLSFGITSTIPHAEISMEMFMVRADEALYEAKAQGRNCIVLK